MALPTAKHTKIRIADTSAHQLGPFSEQELEQIAQEIKAFALAHRTSVL